MTLLLNRKREKPIIKKKLLFSSIALLSCLAVLFGALLVLPKAAHAAPVHLAKTAAPTISVSPTTMNSGSSNCSYVGTINDQPYASCIVTITINGSPSQGVKFTSSYNATTCYTSCVPFNYVALLPNAGTLYSRSTISIIVPEVQHGSEYVDIYISGPANKVKVHFDGYNTCC